jgi:MFS family permease
MFFVGWAFAAPFVLRLVDVFGRKKVYMIDMSLHAVLFILVTFSKSLNLTIALSCFMGVFSVGRAAISYLYL